MVELLRSYSKLPIPSVLRQIERSKPVQRPPRVTPRRVSHRLSREVVNQLCADYQAGATQRELARTYGISKQSVAKLLQERGVPARPRGLSSEQLEQATQLYLAGKSVVQVGQAMNQPPNTIYDALKRTGVQMRDRHSRSASTD